MAQLGEAVTRYHKLLEQPPFRDTGWASEFQDEMRRRHLVESGRLLTPVLRPYFISRRQLDALSRLTAQMAEILDRVAALVFSSPLLLNRLQMLPAEKMLATAANGHTRPGIASSWNAHLYNGAPHLQGWNACKPAGLAYSSILADLFLDLPLLKEFKRGRYKLSRLGGTKHLLQAIQTAYRQSGGKGKKPSIAIVEMAQEGGSPSEGVLLAESIREAGGDVRVLTPDVLEYSGGRLRAADFEIDVVFRRILTRELLTRWDLSHPLLRAYRDHAVCVVNNFRSEFAQRRSLFDLLTDETLTAHLPAADRKLIRHSVPWTRVVSQRKTSYGGEMVDLPAHILNQREKLVLLPNEDGADQRSFVGMEMTPANWERALKQALRESYVVQERNAPALEKFPIFQYGELKMREAEVAVHPHVLNGEMSGASAALQTSMAGAAAQLAITPVLLLEEA